MNPLRRLWSRWAKTPPPSPPPKDLEAIQHEQVIQGWVADQHEADRKAHVETLPEPPDLTNDPQTDVPAPHPGIVQHVDLSAAVRRGEPAPTHYESISPSDWDLLSPDEQALFEQITPRDEFKVIKLPAPVEQTTAEWVTERLQKAGYSEAYHLRFTGFRRVAIGMSMRHLGTLKARAEAKDPSLSVHDLLALRQRGIA